MGFAFHRKLLALCAVVLALGSLSPPRAAATAAGDKQGSGSEQDSARTSDNVVNAARDRRLADKGLSAGSPIFVRIFKLESALELWVQKEDRFELFAVHRICNWSGGLGPKLHEGDKQSPEGLYTVGPQQIHRKGRWPRSLNIGFPNALDRAYARTGSLILVHGGCTSTGCYAMTNPVMEEIYSLADQALRQGQQRFQVHVFPFRMTEDNLRTNAKPVWQAFWLNLKEAYDIFERTHLPPSIGVCHKRYVVREAAPAGTSGQPSDPLACTEGEIQAVVAGADSEQSTVKARHRGRKVASKTRGRRMAGRNARKTYAAVRRAHSRRMRTSSTASSRREH